MSDTDREELADRLEGVMTAAEPALRDDEMAVIGEAIDHIRPSRVSSGGVEFGGDAKVLARHYGRLLGYLSDMEREFGEMSDRRFMDGYAQAIHHAEWLVVGTLAHCGCGDAGDGDRDLSGIPSQEKGNDGEWHCTECGADLQPTLDAVRDLGRGDTAAGEGTTEA